MTCITQITFEFINGDALPVDKRGFISVIFRSPKIFLLVNTGCSSWLTFSPRSRSSLHTTSADFWCLKSKMIRTGLFAGTAHGVLFWSWEWLNLLMVESRSFSGYFHFKKTSFSILHSSVLLPGNTQWTPSIYSIHNGSSHKQQPTLYPLTYRNRQNKSPSWNVRLQKKTDKGLLLHYQSWILPSTDPTTLKTKQNAVCLIYLDLQEHTPQSIGLC